MTLRANGNASTTGTDFRTALEAMRSAGARPNADLEIIENARTFSTIGRPDRLADQITEFVSA